MDFIQIWREAFPLYPHSSLWIWAKSEEFKNFTFVLSNFFFHTKNLKVPFLHNVHKISQKLSQEWTIPPYETLITHTLVVWMNPYSCYQCIAQASNLTKTMQIKHWVYLVVGTTHIIIRMDHCTLWHICRTHTRSSDYALVMFPSHHPTKLHSPLWGHFFQALHFVSLVAHTYLIWLLPKLTFVILTVPTVYPMNGFKIRDKNVFFIQKITKYP